MKPSKENEISEMEYVKIKTRSAVMSKSVFGDRLKQMRLCVRSILSCGGTTLRNRAKRSSSGHFFEDRELLREAELREESEGPNSGSGMEELNPVKQT